jgi:hypothetical protein
MLRKFIETIYESPLNLLLLGSAAISAIMGNIDDAVSITMAILIVLTGTFHFQGRQNTPDCELLGALSWIRARTKVGRIPRSPQQTGASPLSLAPVLNMVASPECR